MVDDAVLHRQLGHRQLVLEGHRPEQLRPRCGGSQPQRLPGVGHAGRAAGEVDAQLAGHTHRGPVGDALRQPAFVPRAEGHVADHRRDVAVQAVVPGGGQLHGAQRHVQFFSHQLRQAGVHALPHLAAVHRQHDMAIGGDLDPAVQCHLAVHDGQHVGMAHARARRQRAPAHDQRARHTDAGQQPGAALHAFIPLAAWRIAARTCG